MKVWPWIKSLGLLLLVCLVLNAAVHLSLLLPYIVKHVHLSSSIGQRMLITLIMKILFTTVAAVLLPALLLKFNFRRSAYGAMLIGILVFMDLPPATALSSLLLMLWFLALILWLAWCKLRDVYLYYRTK
ncbi:hypothetical protein [Pseudomonas sp. CF161]|jgi:hypothetical protein|uniref:hypothetical protein n=1 Tax=Pseudomonas sp. CF161 TaxID=911241 RepID=UPI000355152B|nr:hypothetical protein [Pseudomonas sp. CF161]EPL03484.1 hypothetical protein CF161_31215 [Pseudomonas sp. CF161]